MKNYSKKNVYIIGALSVLFCGSTLFFKYFHSGHNYVRSVAKFQAETHNDNLYRTNINNLSSVTLNNIIIPTYDGSNQAMHPKALYFPNKWNGWTYWMAFTPYKNTNAQYENPSIVVSQDGLYWRVPPKLINPVIPPPKDVLRWGHNSDPALVMNGNKMELWYRYNPGNAEGTDTSHTINQIYRVTSTDGVNWTKPQIIFDSQVDGLKSPFLSPSVLFEDGKYKVWFASGSGSIYYTESTDCKNWNIPVQNQISVQPYCPWHLDVIHTNVGYEMVFCAYPKGQLSKDNQSLFYANSSDGIRWSSIKQIITPYVATNRLDNKQIYRSTLLKVKDLYRLYYSAMNNRFAWHILLKQGKTIDSLQDVELPKQIKKSFVADRLLHQNKKVVKVKAKAKTI